MVLHAARIPAIMTARAISETEFLRVGAMRSEAFRADFSGLRGVGRLRLRGMGGGHGVQLVDRWRRERQSPRM